MLGQINNFIILWVIIDPIAALSIFVSLTAEYDRRSRRRIATAAVLAAFLVLCFFIGLGQIIIEAMGVSLSEFQIAGGLILFLFAVTMVIGGAPQALQLRADPQTGSEIAIYPLAIPTLAGPGAMLTVMLLTDRSRFSTTDQLTTAATVAVVLAITLAMLFLADPILRLIGLHGANVLKRIMGMVLAAVAVKIILGGIADWLHLPASRIG
ncbi:MAG TPA: MarC family protein [Stellaceae bacterium]|nr:MarC family protein [Stellaceae bacterium]